MRMIHVQVQPERAKRLDVAAADESFRRIAKNKSLVRHFKFEEGSGRYMNFNYLTTKPAQLWKHCVPGHSALDCSALPRWLFARVKVDGTTISCCITGTAA